MLASLTLLAGCRQDMHDQPKYIPLRPVDQVGTVSDGRSARPLVEGAVPRDDARNDIEFYTGKLRNFAGLNPGAVPAGRQQGANQAAANQPGTNQQGQNSPAQQFQGFVTEFPMPITAADLDRGEERFNIYCSVCHGLSGDGQGMIVKRGFKRPPSYHEDRLRQAPVGYFFDVITNGFSTMPDYASQISPRDRWRIISYIRALQLSQHATEADVPADKLGDLSKPPEKATGKEGEHER